MNPFLDPHPTMAAYEAISANLQGVTNKIVHLRRLRLMGHPVSENNLSSLAYQRHQLKRRLRSQAGIVQRAIEGG